MIVEIVASEDDQTDAAPGVEAATKLVQSDGVQVIIGALASTVSLAVAESVTVPNQIVQISPASTSATAHRRSRTTVSSGGRRRRTTSRPSCWSS